MQAPRFGFRPSAPRKPWQPSDVTKDRRLRGRAGQRDRRQILQEEPLCRMCLDEGRTEPSVQVDHIKPLSEGGTEARSNKQGLCLDHHNAKSKAERAAARRPSID
jgi:5-methylcytosine-specific restriction protein A